MTELADIFNQYGGLYQRQYGERLLPSHRATLKAVVDCRTPQLGGRVYHCSPCDETHYSYHSCQNRHCPKCQTQNGGAWLEKQTTRLLPTSYFLLTFTVPQELREIIRAHQKELYNLLFRASAEATQQLARDPRLIGAKIGMVGVLHTWGRNLVYHPHVHYLVPAGGLTEQGVWRATSHNFFLPVKALSRVFRAKFRDGLRHTDWFGDIPTHVWQSEWVVHCKPVGNGNGALKYLAPYIFRVAISNRRIIKVVNDKVSFRFRFSDTGKWRTCRLEVLEFIRRFLQHTLPKGFVKVRYYGLFSPGNRHLLATARHALIPPDAAEATVNNRTDDGTSGEWNKSTNQPQTSLPLCPVCGREMVLTLRLKRVWTRRPP